MTTYSYGQLEQLWVNAGGDQALAPVMAAIAMAESGGNDTAYNSSGATGLWQILGAVNSSDQSSLTNPQTNAREAVLKYQTQGLGAWVTYTSGAYKQFLQGNVQPTPTGLPSQNQQLTQGSPQNAAPQSATSTNVSSALSSATGLLRDVATALDYVFGMFGRGQGWRMIFTLVAAVALYGSYKALVSAGAVPAGLIPNTVVILWNKAE